MECQVSKGTIHYVVHGEGSPILLLHAMGTDHRSMTSWVEPIFTDRTGWKRVYIDIPAHGKSTINKNVKGTEDFLDMLLEFIDKLFPHHSFAIAGMSYGGYLAQGIVSRRRERIKGICLVSSALHLPDSERTLPAKAVYEEDQSSIRKLDEDARNAFQLLMVYQNQANLDAFMNEIQPGRLLADREFLASDWRKENYYYSFDPLEVKGQLEQPTLIIVGKQDSIVGYEDHFRFLRPKFSRATFAVLDGAGHLVPIERRATLVGLVTDWLLRME